MTETVTDPWSDPGSSHGRSIQNRFLDAASQLAAAGALIVIFVFLSITSPVFLTVSNLTNILVQTTVTAIIAVGMTFVIITAGIDLSVGAVAALAGVVGAKLMVDQHVSPALALLGGCVVGGLAGFLNGLLVTRLSLAPFIATLGMQSVARGLVLIITSAVAVYGVPNSFQSLGVGKLGPIPVPVLFLIVVAVAGHLVLKRTRLGRYSYAIGSNRDAARLSGIPVARVLLAVYVLQGALAGLGGLISVARVASGEPNFGIGLELDVIAAAVIGGASLFGGQGTVLGTLIGAFLIAFIRNGSVLLGIDVLYQSVIIGVVIWAAVAWDQFRRKRLTRVA